MKPDWKDAPEWAQWLAMDEDGGWYWFEHQPKLLQHAEVWMRDTGRHGQKTRYTAAGNRHDFTWSDSLEPRP